MRLLLATTNAGKLREIRAILAGLPIETVSLEAYPTVAEPEEHGATFTENARAKALAYADLTGEIAVAEDSGLEVELLGGAPGVQSARFGGPEAEAYPDKFKLIYDGLRAHGADTSPARFVCALALAAAGSVVFEARGVVEGQVSPEPRGDGGFGYDPIFCYPPYGRTLAEVSAGEKAAVSHRGQAFRALRRFLEEGGLKQLAGRARQHR